MAWPEAAAESTNGPRHGPGRGRGPRVLRPGHAVGDSAPPRAVRRGPGRRGQLKPAMLATVRPAERTRQARRCGAIETEMTCTASVAVYWTVQSSPPEGPASRFAGHTIRMRGREPRPPASARARSERQPSSRRSSRCPQARIGASDWAYRYDRGECPKGKTVLPPPVFRRLFFGLAAFPPANATPLLSVLILFRGLFSQTNPQRYEHMRDGTIPVDHIFRLIDFTFHKVGP